MARQAGHPDSETARMRIGRWLARYGPAELAAIAASYAGYFGTIHAGGGPLLAAWIAALTENAGFYGVMLWRQWRQAPPGGRMPAMLRLGAEFGPAELLDSAVFRPLALAGAVALVGPAWGVLVGKLVADAGFYALAIAMHEQLRRRDRRDQPACPPDGS